MCRQFRAHAGKLHVCKVFLMCSSSCGVLVGRWKLFWQFQQLKNQFASIKSTTTQSTPTEELLKLSDKLQHLTMALQPATQSSEKPVHKTMQVYTDTLHATQRESNLTTIMLYDIPTFDGQHSSKLEDWVLDMGDCHWHLNWKPHMPGWGKVTWPHPHTHPWGHPNRKVLFLYILYALGMLWIQSMCSIGIATHITTVMLGCSQTW